MLRHSPLKPFFINMRSLAPISRTRTTDQTNERHKEYKIDPKERKNSTSAYVQRSFENIFICFISSILYVGCKEGMTTTTMTTATTTMTIATPSVKSIKKIHTKVRFSTFYSQCPIATFFTSGVLVRFHFVLELAVNGRD